MIHSADSSASQPTVLFVSSGRSIAATRRWVLERAGYTVTLARTTEKALRVLGDHVRIDVLLIGAVTRNIDIARVIESARQRKPRVLAVCAARTTHPKSDFHVTPLAGPEALLRAVGEAVVTAHGHRFSATECVMFVDRTRRYVHVTDPAAELVGYAREDLLGMRIDDISAPDMDVSTKFESYIQDGAQHGIFSLRHRKGGIVRVRYRARVLEDGCMVSRLEKMPDETAVP